ncbi:hypothetical protein SISSUDRAFT_243478 [Sistotremastrum suecicum HHB10207 ss-3]|uniref:Uncharacterized protein n=1 Tax=Sistotremastrum suecicum HHB10207 ss-3 TaxID=1314776 RepID=A0A166A0B5_9AGAM|nr:hypothetical protein SISSUDRAFT_243478 [Sistotremastrum suecicum HHB10207 ss-3]
MIRPSFATPGLRCLLAHKIMTSSTRRYRSLAFQRFIEDSTWLKQMRIVRLGPALSVSATPRDRGIASRLDDACYPVDTTNSFLSREHNHKRIWNMTIFLTSIYRVCSWFGRCLWRHVLAYCAKTPQASGQTLLWLLLVSPQPSHTWVVVCRRLYQPQPLLKMLIEC